MRRLTTLIFTVFAVVFTAIHAQEPRQSVGLVLSGGGAKGIAHIGVIQALEDNDIPIDYITGTSMGSIVGGLYSMGYTPAEMLDLILSRGFSYWSTGKIDPNLTYYFNREAESPSMFSFPLGKKSAAADSVPASVISPQPMSFAFMDLFSAYTAQCGGDFDRLFVPFRCVASDPAAKRKHVFGSGQLGDAIRASMSFPVVFQPISIDGVLYYDGGIYDNFPVDVMRDTFAPSIMIGVDVSTEDLGPQTTLMDQIENLVIQNNDYELPADEGIKLKIDLNEFSLLDFPAARRIYQVGYDHAMSMMDSIRGRVVSRTPKSTRNLERAAFKSATPYLRFDKVEVSGASPRQNEYIKYLFRPRSDEDTIGIPRAREAFYRAISSGKLQDLYPQAIYNDSTGLFTLTLKAAVKNRFRGSLGGYISSSTSRFLYISADYSTLSFRSLNAGISAWIGQTNMAGMVNGRIYLHTPLSSAIGVQAVVSRERFYETDHMFFEASEPTFIINHEYFGRAFWSFATGRLGMVEIGAGYGALRSSYYRNNRLDSYEQGRIRSELKLGQAFARYTSSTLDAPNFPTSGHSYMAAAMGMIGSGQKWVQGEIKTRNYPTLGNHFALGIETDIMLSTRKLMDTYSASITTAPAFIPTPAANNAFHPALRANSFLSAGLIPVYKLNANLSARVGGYAFVPLRNIEEVGNDTPRYGRWFSNPEFFGEADITYNFPFASLTGYLNYTTVPGAKWGVGLSFGIYILPPKFLR